MDIVVLLILASFTLTSAFYQIKSIKNVIRKFDKFRLLPNYTFFAPTPVSFDYKIVYRLTNNSKSRWHEIPIHKDFSFSRTIWNPSKYYQKCFIDSCQLLLQEYSGLDDEELIKTSIHYINLSTLISKVLSQVKENIAIRFIIINSTGIRDVHIQKVVFTPPNQII